MAHPCASCHTPVPDAAAFCPACGAPTPTRLSQEVGPDFEPKLKAALAERYRIERELGRGGMAIVFLAQDLKHERQVAVKVLRPELAASLGADRFLREIRIAAKLQHPHILALYDSGEADGFLYYVMPFVEGESLRDKLNREKQLGIEEALQLTREICDGLGYAHEQGIVHRDIKPENVLLSRGHPLVADFGIARAVSAAGGVTLTATGTSIGTPLYMSPEQAAGDPSVDHRSDLYSVGCVLYEMLAGEPPFTGPNVQGIMAKHAIEPRPSVRTVRDTVPEGIDAAIRQAMAKVPADRMPDAEALAHALRAGEVSQAEHPAASGSAVEEAGRAREPRLHQADMEDVFAYDQKARAVHDAVGGIRRAAKAHRAKRRWRAWHSIAAVASVAVVGGAGAAWLLRSSGPTWTTADAAAASSAWEPLGLEGGMPRWVGSSGDSLLLVDATFGQHALQGFDGTTWRTVDVGDWYARLGEGDTTWVLTISRLFHLSGDSLVDHGELPTRERVFPVAWSRGDELVVGMGAGQIWRRRAGAWR